MEKISVLVVDDHEIVRQGIIGFLEVQPDMAVVGEASSGEAAVKLAAATAPDVMVVDLVMPGMDGVEATAQVRRISPRTQVVVLTSHHTDEHIFPAIRAGALSYILKDIRPKDMLEAIRAAARGEAVINAQVAARLISEMYRTPTADADPFLELTARERDVLHLIADGLTNQEIADQLVLSLTTVKGYVSNILGKLHLADRTQAAVMAWREGFKQRNS